jgi:signal transduction histidine kinase
LAWQGELINCRKDGVLYDLALTLTPIHNEQGELTGFVGVYRDISRLKELERLKDQFVTRIGHELRTPVANVKLYLDLLERGKPERRAQYLQTLNSETVRLRKMVDGFLEISELDAGAEPVRPVALDLNHLVTDLIAGQQALAGQRGLVIDVHSDPDLPWVLVDRMMIDKALTNVLTNALDYTPRGGRITVSTARRQHDECEWITVSIQDTGPGIAPEEVAHVFERFYRGKASGNFTVPGAGLGLSICKIILDKLGGRITVESPAGQGATFTIWLRMAETAAEAA